MPLGGGDLAGFHDLLETPQVLVDVLAGRIAEVVRAIEADDRAAAPALLQAQASLRVFERILTLEVAAGALRALAGGDEAGEEP